MKNKKLTTIERKSKRYVVVQDFFYNNRVIATGRIVEFDEKTALRLKLSGAIKSL